MELKETLFRLACRSHMDYMAMVGAGSGAEEQDWNAAKCEAYEELLREAGLRDEYRQWRLRRAE